MIGGELGVTGTLLQKWCSEGGPSLVRVEVEEAASTVPWNGLLVRTPEGFAIEGLDMSGAVELLQRLR